MVKCQLSNLVDVFEDTLKVEEIVYTLVHVLSIVSVDVYLHLSVLVFC